jgi:hypothetical protein
MSNNCSECMVLFVYENITLATGVIMRIGICLIYMYSFVIRLPGDDLQCRYIWCGITLKKVVKVTDFQTYSRVHLTSRYEFSTSIRELSHFNCKNICSSQGMDDLEGVGQVH